MGIQLGFATFLWEEVYGAKTPWYRRVHVAEECQAGRFLVVDGISLINHLYDESNLDRVFGGQAAAFEARVLQWAEALMDVGVELCIVFGGIGAAEKRGKNLRSCHWAVALWDDVAAECPDPCRHLPRPPTAADVGKDALRRLAAGEVGKARPMLHLHFAFEEADPLTAELSRHPNAIGILSDDPGLVFHAGCVLLPLPFFTPESAVALDAPALAGHLNLPMEVYPLLPGIAGCDFLSASDASLSAVHQHLVKQCPRAQAAALSYGRKKLLSVLHFLRIQQRPDAVFRALSRLLPGAEGAKLLAGIHRVLHCHAAQDPSQHPEVGQSQQTGPLEDGAVTEEWEDLWDPLGGQPRPAEPPPSSPHPFQFHHVDLPPASLRRLVAGLREHEQGTDLLYLLARRDDITRPFLEALDPPPPGMPEAPLSQLSCADAKLALLRRVLYGLVFRPGAAVCEVVRTPDGVEEVPAVAPLRGPGLPTARELLDRDAEARWQWLTAVLGLEAVALPLGTPAALSLAAFFMVGAHYRIPANVVEAWLCAALCPREEGSRQPDAHPRLGPLPSPPPGPPASLLQGFAPAEAALPALHAHYLRVVQQFATALDLPGDNGVYFDSVVYRCLLRDASHASGLPWYPEVQRWLQQRQRAVDYFAGLCARLAPGEGEAALAALLAQQEAGWARRRAAEAPVTGTVEFVQRRPGQPRFAVVNYLSGSNAEPQTKRIYEESFPNFDALVRDSVVTFRLRHDRVVGLVAQL